MNFPNHTFGYCKIGGTHLIDFTSFLSPFACTAYIFMLSFQGMDAGISNEKKLEKYIISRPFLLQMRQLHHPNLL